MDLKGMNKKKKLLVWREGEKKSDHVYMVPISFLILDCVTYCLSVVQVLFSSSLNQDKIQYNVCDKWIFLSPYFKHVYTRVSSLVHFRLDYNALSSASLTLPHPHSTWDKEGRSVAGCQGQLYLACPPDLQENIVASKPGCDIIRGNPLLLFT